MKKQTNGFTLWELIVVVSIIALLSSTAVFSFLSSGQKQNFIRQLSTLENTISFFDRSLWKDITDYRVSFLTGQYYITSVNELYKDAIQTWMIHNTTLILSNTTTQTGIYQVYLYKNNKFQQNLFTNSTGSFSYQIENTSRYKILWFLNGSPLNILEIIPYWSNNSREENNIFLVENTWEIRRYLSQNKQFFHNNSPSSNGISLLFEEKSYQHTLHLK